MKFGAFSSLLVTLALVCSSVMGENYTEATDATFDSLVLKSKVPVVVLLCTPREMQDGIVAPYVEDAVYDNPPATMVYVDADKYPGLVKEYEPPNIPAIMGFNGGNLRNIYVGPLEKDLLTNFVREISS